MSSNNCFLLIFGFPKGSEIGIDMQSWFVGEKFEGIKLIPQGLHFIYYRVVGKYNDLSPLSGFFHFFKEGEVVVKNFDPVEEVILDENDSVKLERIKSNLRNLDRTMGPYPIDSWSKWVSLTQYIDELNLHRLQPLSGRINSAPECVNTEKFVSQKDSVASSSNSDINLEIADDNSKPESKLPNMVPIPGTEFRFSKFPNKPHGKDATPSEISRGNIDSSYTVSFLLEQLEKAEDILAELQFSFVCFLVGQSFDAWDYWKILVITLCKAEDTLIQHPALYQKFLSILYYQIQEVPEDLFADIVENNNFLVASLRFLFANIKDNSSSLPCSIVSKASKFRSYLTSKYHWGLELDEEEEDLPVVVEGI